MKIDKETTYQNLRDEAIDTVKRQDTFLLATYTMCISVWSIAFNVKEEWIALFPLIFLILLSLKICELRRAVVFLASYMEVFLEEGSLDGWENIKEEYYRKYRRPYRKIFSYCSKVSFSVLSFISSLLFWIIRDFDLIVFGHKWIGYVIIAVQIFFVLLQGIIWWMYSDTSTLKAPLVKDWKELYSEINQKIEDENRK